MPDLRSDQPRPAMSQALEATLGAWDAVLPAKPRSAEEETPVPPSVIPGAAFVAAVKLAVEKHGHQGRKGTQVPYLTHLLAVASLVGESGGSEEEMIAAMLHDVVEDAGGSLAYQEIRFRFGDTVAEIVAGCTDDDGDGPKAPWLERKRAFLTSLVAASHSVLRVVCADKLHNARSIERDFKEQGVLVFRRFKGDREGTMWYYRGLARIYSALLQDEPNLDSGFRGLIRDLRETVARLEG